MDFDIASSFYGQGTSESLKTLSHIQWKYSESLYITAVPGT